MEGEAQERLDMPELVWKRYIDLEVSQNETDNARKVWQQLVSKSHHVRVYIAYSDFEAVTCQSMPKAREALEAGSRHFKVESRNEERAMLLEHLLKLEKEHGDDDSVKAAEKKQPERVKKRKAIQGEDGQEAFEEYMDYNFPEDSSETQNLKILEMARSVADSLP
ncbi:CRNKL1 [Symbiodinium natans]|uniref:CRNKL1 protein n=1 Tax=Symbiodinium natans TaxID=878477 RepID=A0A812RZE1_9DINO|nr:CRNKL1 [Symbiodinium natans]